MAEFIFLLRSHLPAGSISLRFRHGDEFLFFLPASPDKARDIFNLFNQFCTHHSFLKKPDGGNFLVSFRFATLELSNTNFETDSILKIAESRVKRSERPGEVYEKTNKKNKMKIEPQIHFLFVSSRKFIIANRKKLNKVFGEINSFL